MTRTAKAPSPHELDIPKLRDGLLELRLRGRWGFDEPPYPPGFHFEMFVPASVEAVGTLLLRVDERPDTLAYAGHLAYEVAPAHRGRGYARRACALVRPLARVYLKQAWIMTAPDNRASMRTAEALGARYVDTRELPPSSELREQGAMQVRRYCWEL